MTVATRRLLPLSSLFSAILIGSSFLLTEKKEREPFRHGPHVSAAWLSSAEVKRDCRGCHDYEKERDPQSACLNCHFQGALELDNSASSLSQNLNPLRDPVRPFQHKDHLRYDCKSCHAPQIDGPAVIPDHLPVSRGAAICQDCHDPKKSNTDKKTNSPELFTRFLTSLNQSPSMSPAGFHPFRHDEHLRKEELEGKNPASCTQCHLETSTANATDLSGKEFSLKTCESCHRGKELNTAFFETKSETLRSVSHGTFPHSKHLSERALSLDANLQREGCFACHQYQNKDSRFELKSGFGNYQGCVSCHAHEPWKVPDHGEIESCLDCHNLDIAEMKKNRPTLEIARPNPEAFSILSQSHPFITTRSAKDDNCAQCHRADAETLSSRIHKEPFNHRTHLSPESKSQECSVCHAKAIEKTPSPAVIYQIYQESACASCHRGSAPQITDAKTETRSVPVFSHLEHLPATPRAGAKALQCLDCHETNPEQGAREMRIKPKALDCSQCHDHRENAVITGGKDQNYVESCARCHVDGIPEKGSEKLRGRLHITNVLASQFHSQEGDCGSCHRIEQREKILNKDPHVFSRKRNSQIHAKAGTPANCLGCHWDRQQIARYQPLSIKAKPGQGVVDAIREQLGNSVDQYPGEKAQ